MSNRWAGEHKCETELTRQTERQGLIGLFVHIDMMDGSTSTFMSRLYGAAKYTDSTMYNRQDKKVGLKSVSVISVRGICGTTAFLLVQPSCVVMTEITAKTDATTSRK